MNKSFEDCLFLIIGTTLTRDDLENIRKSPSKTAEYVSTSCLFAKGLYEIMRALASDDQEAVFKEVLARFESKTMN